VLADAAVSTEVVPVFNPLSEERAVMRTSLLPGLVANARHARRRQVEQVCLFEVGRTYHPEPGAPLPREGRVAAVLLCGPRSAWIGPGNAMDFYDAKGVVEQLLPPVVGASPVVELSDDPAPYLHPRKQAAVEVAGHPVGRVGQIHPEVADRLELDVAAFFVELDTEALLHAQAQLGVPQAAPLPRYPAVHRDIAMVVDEAHEVRAIATTLSEAAGGLVEGVELFDLYRGDPVPAGKKSVAFRITYRDPEATLTDKRVDKLHKKAAEAAQSRLGAQLRE
jgi:phenylalanyl-tRNA synthetase beta chain